MRDLNKWMILGGMLSVTAHAQWSWPSCPDVTSADFTKVSLVDRSRDPSLDEPTKFAVAPDGRILFIERKSGKVKIRRLDGSIVTAITLTGLFNGPNMLQGGQNEFGMHGIAVPHDFLTSRLVYLNYAVANPRVWRISRMTLNGDALDRGSEQVIMEIPAQYNRCCHAGGGMQFDYKGDLWMSIGNNTTNPDVGAGDGYVTEGNADGDDQAHAANTNDLRGKVLRIHPETNLANNRYYSIPGGNLFPSTGTACTRGSGPRGNPCPEIWGMGMRNPFTLWVDESNGWVTWGDIGPDNGWDTEEYNLFKSPGFAGWPYFAGAAGNAHYSFRMGKNAGAPVNNSPNNSGMTNLPPARGAIVGYRQAAAVTGPIYRYNGALKSTTKLPPHFNGKWFVSDFNGTTVSVASLNGSADAVTDRRTFLSNLARPLQLSLGPEGALYVLEYAGWFSSTPSTRISRYEYKGTCLPDQPVGIDDIAKSAHAPLYARVNLGFSREIALPDGVKGFRLYDLHGKTAWEFRAGAESPKYVAVPADLGNGVYRVTYTR